MQYAHYEQSRLRTKTKCRDEDCLIPRMPQHGTLLCTCEYSYKERNPDHLHVLLHRISMSVCGIGLALVAQMDKQFWHIELDDTLLQIYGRLPTAPAIRPVPDDSRGD
jgi:hypothetical protein